MVICITYYIYDIYFNILSIFILAYIQNLNLILLVLNLNLRNAYIFMYNYQVMLLLKCIYHYNSIEKIKTFSVAFSSKVHKLKISIIFP